uniref:IgGFc_binding domain-containing protein n=1 Tax=Rhabditophanes sp. KR3021 TaxID=114890 RepID=A0AC35TGQ9_9BILA
MFIKYICVFFIAVLLIVKANAADSDGKEFVLTFVQDVSLSLSQVAKTTVIVIPSYNHSTCSFHYTQNTDGKVVTLTREARYGSTNEFNLDINEVVVMFDYGQSEFENYATKDFRIFVNCTEQVKLIGKIADSVSGWGDLFLVPSLKNAATHYTTFAMPMTDTDFKGTLAILPVNKEGSINVTITGYVNNEFFSNETIQYNTTLGQNQHYIGIYFDKISGQISSQNINASIAISATSPVMLSFESPQSTTSDIDSNGSCGSICYTDFVQFMPIASQPIQCNSILTGPDQRMVTDDFTTRLHVSPPNVGANCNAITNISVYNGNFGHKDQAVDSMGFTQISLMNNEFAGISTYGGQVSTNRFGSIFVSDGVAGDSPIMYGHFMHYLPSTREWVQGKTQFYTLAKRCALEIYADNSNANAVNEINIDGHVLGSLIYQRNDIPFFKTRYSQFIVSVKGYGLHKIEFNGKYVAYVICDGVNSYVNANGYLTGFNQRK